MFNKRCVYLFFFLDFFREFIFVLIINRNLIIEIF